MTAMDAQFVADQRGVLAVVEAIRAASAVAFDTEFVGEAAYEPVLCLIQIATDTGIWVLDPLANLDLDEFWQMLTEPGREIVAVAPRQEVLFCLRFAGRPPNAIFDPQRAAGLLGWSYPLSHTNLLRQVLDIRVEGGETYTDWQRRPLSPGQLAYAADDVRHLLALRTRLLARAEGMGRLEWISDECARWLARLLETEGEERWWRTSGASNLSRRDLAVLRELWRWRDQRARRRDLPARRIIGDDLLLAVVRRKPKTLEDLFALRGLDRPWVRPEGPSLIAAVDTGLNVPERELPLPLRHDDPPQMSLLVQLASIVANSMAAQNHVDPALLATANDLQELVRWQLAMEGDSRPFLLEGWRGEILGKALVDLLTGRSTVRVNDIHDVSPLAIQST